MSLIPRRFAGISFDLFDTFGREVCWLCTVEIVATNDPQHIVIELADHSAPYRTHIACFHQLGYSMFTYVNRNNIEEIESPKRIN